MQIRTQHRPNLWCIARGRSARAGQLCPSRGSTLEPRSSSWLATLRTPSPSRSKPAGSACTGTRRMMHPSHTGGPRRAGGRKGERSAPPYPRPLSTASTSCALPRPTQARLCPHTHPMSVATREMGGRCRRSPCARSSAHFKKANGTTCILSCASWKREARTQNGRPGPKPGQRNCRRRLIRGTGSLCCGDAARHSTDRPSQSGCSRCSCPHTVFAPSLSTVVLFFPQKKFELPVLFADTYC
jgi:hypothetical protein